MKKRVKRGIGVLALLAVVGMGVLLVPKTEPTTLETVRLRFDWNQEIAGTKLALSDVGLPVRELSLKSVFPTSANLSDKVFSQLRMRFESGQEEGDVVVCDAVVRLKMLPGDHLRLSVSSVESVIVKGFDAKGQKLSKGFESLERAAEERLADFMLEWKTVQIDSVKTDIEDGSLSFHADGIEYRVRGKAGR